MIPTPAITRSMVSTNTTNTIIAWRGLSLHACCALRFFGYSAFDSIRKPPKQGRRASSSSSSSSFAASNISCGVNSTGGDANPYNSNSNSNSSNSGGGIRMRQTPSERRREAKQIFPETLKSGRYKQQETKAQRLYKGPNTSNEKAPDRRFFRRLADYREVQDDDPYAGVFRERASVQKRRVQEWQRQFEEENADVELPYERTNVLAKLAPNWFVRFFVDMRDKGGVDHLGYLLVCLLVTVTLLWCVGYLCYTPPSKSRPIAEVR
ncbi:uncharacterized protein TM35_002731000 [Trypanosoma theileri]|uniref:Transmembrane protein n=1 Tax=Trypanosoma theileri TaxID=67003 RepID=A0A1X0ND78_9TRYP|nr:uncharacterized protein TM35_002731000 [Trypanosoma theileri]ORC77268.1 hypothetical protein TM35_002731000 [Trypanosoma theileri]